MARSKLVMLFLNPFVTKKLHSSGFFGIKFPLYIKNPNIFSWLSYFGYLFSNIFWYYWISIPTIFYNSFSKIYFELWDNELPNPKYIPSYKVLYTPYLKIKYKLYLNTILFIYIY